MLFPSLLCHSTFTSSSLSWPQPWRFPGLISSTFLTLWWKPVSLYTQPPIMCWCTCSYWRKSRTFRPGQSSPGWTLFPAWTIISSCLLTNSWVMSQVETDFPAGHPFQAHFKGPHTTAEETPSLFCICFTLHWWSYRNSIYFLKLLTDKELSIKSSQPGDDLTWSQSMAVGNHLWATGFSLELPSRICIA